MIAHIRKSDHAVQPLYDHCTAVSRLCSENARSMGFSKLAALIGLMHDMGKATKEFKKYLYSFLSTQALPSPHHHSLTGAIFAYRRWFQAAGASMSVRTTAQLVMLCIAGHHTGLTDCLEPTGDSPLLRSLKTEEALVYPDQAESWFLQNVADESQLDSLFAASCKEVKAHFPLIDNSERLSKTDTISLGLICRYLLSLLIDADRWDSSCFEYVENPFQNADYAPDWDALLHTFEHYRKENLGGKGSINQIRAEISDACYEGAASKPSIFTLSVPTGGGKTFSSLRFALRHAAVNHQKRIFYIIPYNTILDQNAKDIRESLSNYPSILEHHSDIIQETEEEQQLYQRLTERWDSDIILTSLVQFLNACYAGPNTDARRFHRLTNSVLIFDEIQSLPKHCKVLFERAIQFLTNICRSTVVLCTATQPCLTLSPAPKELVSNGDRLYERLKRVQYIPDLNPSRTYTSSASEIARLLAARSVLAILNTKSAAWTIYQETKERLQEAGYSFASLDPNLSEDQITAAAEAVKDEVLCIHMSTLLCPAHRKKQIAWIKAWLKAGKKVLCVSTALIEAGINVSFPIVIRDLAGLPSIVQAGGRANRNMELPMGDVLIWNYPEEVGALGLLEDIQHGAEITQRFLHAGENQETLDSPQMIQRYFEAEAAYTKEKQSFPCRDSRGRYFTLADLLANNPACYQPAQERKSARQLVLPQSFRTASAHFRVIPDQTTAVLVPWGDGAEIIAALSVPHSMREEIQLLRKAQAYSVSLYDQMIQQLDAQDALTRIGEKGIYALKKGFYTEEDGINLFHIFY